MLLCLHRQMACDGAWKLGTEPASGWTVPSGRASNPSELRGAAESGFSCQLDCLQVEYLDTAVSGLLASRLTVVESEVQEISRRSVAKPHMVTALGRLTALQDELSCISTVDLQRGGGL